MMRKKSQVSFIIRDEEERRHKNGVASLQLDPTQGRLYSAGRDGIIRVWDTAPGVQDRYIQSMEHHTDWVNDIVLCCGGKNLISASSDTTVKVWNAPKGSCMSTLRTHKDCVQTLAYAKDKEQLASAGFDRALFLWDVNTLTTLTASNNTVKTSNLLGNKEFIYSLAMNPAGTILVSGSADKILRAWDPRNGKRLLMFKGHSDSVNALVVSRDGQQLVSGSSDGVLKHWSCGERKCIATIKRHSGAIFSLLATESFSHVISAGEDKRVILTELQNPGKWIIVCEETAPILKMCFTADGEGVWVSTSESDVRCWKLPPLKVYTESSNNVYQTHPITNIPGGPTIKHYEVLNDKRHILTKDTANNIALYDVLKACKLEDLGEVDYEEELKKQNTIAYVPDWFDVDINTGMLKIHLGRDEKHCFSAWVRNEVAQLSNNEDEAVNYGALLLRALLKYWNHPNRITEFGQTDHFFVPLHTPLLLSDVSGSISYYLKVNDAGGDVESRQLMDIVPAWVVDVAIEMEDPKLKKLPFYLLPYGNTVKEKKDRLAVMDYIQCRKVAAHVAKVLCCDDPQPAVELLIGDQVLDLNMDIRTVRHFFWKSDDDLILYYIVL